jgi:hypothetical protein
METSHMKLSVALSAMWMVLHPPAAFPQDADVAVLQAVLSYLKVERLQNTLGEVLVDPRILPKNHSGPRITAEARRDSSKLAALNIPQVASVLPVEKAAACMNAPATPTCWQNGKFAGATLSEPTISGDSATLVVFLAMGRALTASDSAEAMANRNPSDPAFWLRRMSRPQAAILQMHLARVAAGASAAGGWRVSRVVFIGGS